MEKLRTLLLAIIAVLLGVIVMQNKTKKQRIDSVSNVTLQTILKCHDGEAIVGSFEIDGKTYLVFE